MTAEEKEVILTNFRTMYEHMTSLIEKEVADWQGVYDQMMAHISTETYVPLRAQLMAAPLQVLDIISARREPLVRFSRMITHVEQTDAADLTKESIKAAGE